MAGALGHGTVPAAEVDYTCLTMPVLGAVDPPLYPIECQCLDTNADGDVDLGDYAVLQSLFAL